MKRYSIEHVTIRFRSASGEQVGLAADLWHPRGRAPRACALFMPGYGSARGGEKATAFGEAFTKRGFVYLTFDPRGHGASSGSIEGLTLDRHLEDLEAAFKYIKRFRLPVAGVGSALGGLTVAAHAARRPRGYAMIIAVGAAFGFFERWRGAARARRPTGLTDAAIASAESLANELLGPRFRTPAILWHGMRDDAVDWKGVAAFAAASRGYVELRLINIGGHRLTEYKHQIAWDAAERAAALFSERSRINSTRRSRTRRKSI